MAGDGKKHIHLFQTTAEHDAAYNGDQYVEPWVSYTVQTDSVDYNKFVHDYSQDYLTFEALESGVIAFTFSYSSSIGSFNSISYSLDNGNTWVTTNNINSREVTVTTPTLSMGQKILWKGDMPIRATQGASTTSNTSATFDVNGGTTGKYKIYGNPKSLFSEDFLNITLNNNGFWFRFLFNVNTTNKSYIIDAKNLILPNTVLPYCYSGMFRNQSQLITPPILPATTLASSCYSYMFQNCENLSYIKMLATDISAINCLSDWVSGVAATGTFVKNSAATWTATGTSGIPSNWTVETASA